MVKAAGVLLASLSQRPLYGSSLRAGVRPARDHSVRFAHAAGKCGNFDPRQCEELGLRMLYILESCESKWTGHRCEGPEGHLDA